MIPLPCIRYIGLHIAQWMWIILHKHNTISDHPKEQLFIYLSFSLVLIRHTDCSPFISNENYMPCTCCMRWTFYYIFISKFIWSTCLWLISNQSTFISSPLPPWREGSNFTSFPGCTFMIHERSIFTSFSGCLLMIHEGEYFYLIPRLYTHDPWGEHFHLILRLVTHGPWGGTLLPHSQAVHSWSMRRAFSPHSQVVYSWSMRGSTFTSFPGCILIIHKGDHVCLILKLYLWSMGGGRPSSSFSGCTLVIFYLILRLYTCAPWGGGLLSHS